MARRSEYNAIKRQNSKLYKGLLCAWPAIMMLLPYVMTFSGPNYTVAFSQAYGYVALGLLLGLWVATLTVVEDSPFLHRIAYSVLYPAGLSITVLLGLLELFVLLELFIKHGLDPAGQNALILDGFLETGRNIHITFQSIEHVIAFICAAMCGFCLRSCLYNNILPGDQQEQTTGFCDGAALPASKNQHIYNLILIVLALSTFVLGATRGLAWSLSFPHSGFPYVNPHAYPAPYQQPEWVGMSPLVLLPVFIMTVLIIESCRLFRFMNVPSFDKHALSTSPLGLVVIPFCAGELFFRFATRIVPRIFSADKLMVYTAFILHLAALATFIVMCACVAQYVYRAKVLTSRTSQGLEQPDLFNHDTKISKPITLEMLNNALPQNIINELKEYGLSQNEIDSVKAEAAGLTSQELAELKGIKASTAREYASRAKRKLNMSLSEAITLFKRDKHIEIHPDDTANITNAQETQVVNKQTFHINTLLWFIAFVLLATLGCTLLLPFGDVAGNKVFVWTHIYGTAGGLLALHGMAWYKSRIITISDKYYLQYSVAFLVLLLMSALCLIWVRIHSYEYLPAIGGGLHKASVIIATSFFVVSLGGLLAILFNQRNVKNGAFQDKAMLYCSLGSVLFISINCIIMSILPTGLSKTIIVVVLTIITVITIGFAIVLIPKDQRPLHFINRGSMLFEGNVATLLAATFVCLLVSYAYEELWRSQSQISLVNSCLPAIGLICCLPMYYIFHVYQQKLYAGVSIAACLLSSVVIGILGQSIAWVMIYCFVLLIIQLAVIFIADGSSNALSEKLNIYLLNSKPPAHNNDQNTDTCSLPVTWHNPYLVCAGALLGSMLIVNACVTLATTSAGRIMIGSTDRAALLNVIIMLLITLVFAVFIVSVIAYEHKKGLLISSFESTSFTERAEGYLKFCGLNDRQVQIALLTAKGMNVKQIAAEIGYSSSTIASERTLIYSCLNVVSSKQLLSLLLKSVRG